MSQRAMVWFRFAAAAFLLAMALVAPLPVRASEIVTLDGFTDFRKPGPMTVERPMAVVVDTLTAFPESLEGRPAIEIDAAKNGDGDLQIDVTESGLMDDSVDAIQRRFVMRQTEAGAYRLVAYGYRQKCGRGENPGEWTAELCP